MDFQKKTKRYMYVSFFLYNTNNGDYMDFNELLSVFIRSILSLATLFLITKLLGKKQVSELSLFDYVIGISIGNFAAEMTINLESSEINGVLAVVIFGIVAYIVSIVTMKSITLRRFFMGTPTIIVQDGKLIKDNMRKVKIDMNDLLQECRIKGFFDLSQIQTGIMEVNGEMSFLPYSKYRPLTPNDMNIKVPYESVQANVIIDGKIMKKNLSNMNKTPEWLEQELKVKGFRDISNILLCTLDNDFKICVYEKNNNVKTKDIFE